MGKVWKHHSVLHGDVQWGKCGNITLCYTEMCNGESVETSAGNATLGTVVR